VAGRKIYLVDKPGAPQSRIRMGRLAPPRKTADYYSIVVLNTILGGAYTSRLNTNLREEHGYTYGAGSAFSFRPFKGPFIATAAVQTEVTAAALTEFINELEGISQPIPADEITKATNYEALSYPAYFQTVSDVANQLGQSVFHNLSDDYFNQYTGHILAVTAADLEAAAGKYIDPENIAIVIVGDRSMIEESLAALDYGEIEVLSVEAVLGKVPEIPD